MTAIRIALTPSSFAESDVTPMRLLESVGAHIIPNSFGRRLTEDEAISQLKDADELIAGLEPLTARVLRASPRLRAIARVGIGIDNIDLGAASDLGIAVSNTPDAPAESVAELTVAAALALTRGLVQASSELHAREWRKRIMPGLRGATILLVGFGRIGRATAARLAPFGVTLLACDPQFSGVPGLQVEQVSLEDGLRRADVISLHAGGRAAILDERAFGLMKDGVIILNSARGELVDEIALVAALESGRVGGAWFDVFWKEPYDGRLCEFANVLLTPHVGTYTGPCRADMELTATVNLLRDLGIQTPQAS